MVLILYATRKLQGFSVEDIWRVCARQLPYYLDVRGLLSRLLYTLETILTIKQENLCPELILGS